jgi:hypothetical protein
MSNKEEKRRLEEEIRSNKTYRTAIFALSILCVAATIAAIVVAALAYTNYQNFSAPASVMGSGPLPNAPYVYYIDSAGAAAALVLPNDLSGYVGNIYRVWSRTAQPHTVTLYGMGTTFDGTTRVATFGGAIGDGLMFEVIAPNRAVVIASINVVFT